MLSFNPQMPSLVKSSWQFFDTHRGISHALNNTGKVSRRRHDMLSYRKQLENKNEEKLYIRDTL